MATTPAATTSVATANQNQENGVSTEGMSVCTNEHMEVHNFIISRQNNCGILELLNEYLVCLAAKHNMKWYECVLYL